VLQVVFIWEDGNESMLAHAADLCSSPPAAVPQPHARAPEPARARERGHGADPVEPASVAALRPEIEARATPFSAAELLELED